MSRKQVDEEHPFVLHTRRELMLMSEDEDFIEWAVEVTKVYVSFPILLKLLNGDNLRVLTEAPWRDDE